MITTAVSSCMVDIPVTVVIPVRNEERNLSRCLQALVRFQNVVIVDSGSSDETVSVAEAEGRDVLQFRWDGAFPKKRNWVLLNYEFATEWVLFIDG